MVNEMPRSAWYDKIKIRKVRTVESFLKSYKFNIFETFHSSGRLKYLI